MTRTIEHRPARPPRLLAQHVTTTHTRRPQARRVRLHWPRHRLRGPRPPPPATLPAIFHR